MAKSHSNHKAIGIALIALVAFGFMLSACNQDPNTNANSSVLNGTMSGKSAAKDSLKAAKKAVKDSIKAASKDKKITSQSIMVGISGPTTFLLQDSSLWSFRDDCGSPYFNVPGVDSSDFVFSDGLTLADKIAVSAIDEKCIFWNGGKLSQHNCNGTIICPLDETVNIPAGQCWVQRPVYAGKAPVTFNITLASQHVEVDKKKSKCDFSSTNADGTPKTATVTVTLIDAVTGATIQVDHPTVTYIKGDKKSNNCLSDTHFEGNGGSIGDGKAMLEDGGTMDDINKDDDDDSNDGDKGCNKKATYVISPITYNLGAGSYKVQVSGALNASTGLVDQSFTGVRTVVVGAAPSCPIPPPQCPFFDPNAGGIAYSDANDRVGVNAMHIPSITSGISITPGSCSVVVGGIYPQLPAGLSVDPSTCVISGIPATPAIIPIYYKVRAQSSCGAVASVVLLNVSL